MLDTQRMDVYDLLLNVRALILAPVLPQLALAVSLDDCERFIESADIDTVPCTLFCEENSGRWSDLDRLAYPLASKQALAMPEDSDLDLFFERDFIDD